MSRKTKFSNNWKKARVTTLHQKIGNTRRDFLHKTKTTISQNHAMVCIEDLQVRNMSGSTAGSTCWSLHGKAAGWWQCHCKTQAGHVRAVVMCLATIARHKPGSSAWSAVSRKTPIWSARSMFQGRNTPGSPVK